MNRLLFLFWCFGWQSAWGQLPPGVIDRLEARAIGNQVQVEVSLSAGYTCNGIVITRSTDSLQFETIGLIGGVCGDSAASVSYSFTDSFPPTNQRLFYQLLLGGRIATDTRQVVVYDFAARPLILAPNPASDWVEVRFEAPSGSTEWLTIFNEHGQEMLREQVVDGYVRISISQLATGSYFIRKVNQPHLFAHLLITR